MNCVSAPITSSPPTLEQRPARQAHKAPQRHLLARPTDTDKAGSCSESTHHWRCWLACWGVRCEESPQSPACAQRVSSLHACVRQGMCDAHYLHSGSHRQFHGTWRVLVPRPWYAALRRRFLMNIELLTRLSNWERAHCHTCGCSRRLRRARSMNAVQHAYADSQQHCLGQAQLMVGCAVSLAYAIACSEC